MNKFQRSPIHIPIATHFLHFRHLELNNITQPTFFTSETSTICRSPAGISRKGRNWYSQSNYQTLPFWKYYGNTIWKIVPNDQIWSNKGKVWFTMAMFIFFAKTCKCNLRFAGAPESLRSWCPFSSQSLGHGWFFFYRSLRVSGFDLRKKSQDAPGFLKGS